MNFVHVKPFQGGLKSLALLLKQSAGKEKRGSYYLGTSELRWLLNSPQRDRKWTVGCYLGRDLIGFSLVLKKRIRLNNGKIIQVALNTLVATKKEARTLFPHLRMIEHAASADEKYGYKLTLGFVDARSPNNRILEVYCRHRYPYFQKFRNFYHYIRRLDLSPVRSSQAIKISGIKIRTRVLPRDITACVGLANRQPRMAFSEYWSARDLAYSLTGPHRMTFLAEKDGRIAGFLSGFRVPTMTGRGKVATLMLMQVCTYLLSPRERTALIQTLLREARRSGIRQVVRPATGSVPVRVWIEQGFMRSLSSVNAYAVSRRVRKKFKIPASFCMEVF